MHIPSEEIARLRGIAAATAQGKPPLVLGTLLGSLEQIAERYPQTLLELLHEPEPRFGEQGVCKMCGATIVYIGPYWQHFGEAQPRHPALPKEE